MKRYALCISLLVCVIGSNAQINIVPQPVSVKVGKGSFVVTSKTLIEARDEPDRKAADILNEYLLRFYGVKLKIVGSSVAGGIRLSTRKFIKAPEKDAYQLTVDKKGVLIDGDTYVGTFYGVETLLQLIQGTTEAQGHRGTQRSDSKNDNVTVKTTEAQGHRGTQRTANHKLSVPFVVIVDYPRFAYRGMHLDVARHFFPTSFVKKYIDYLAFHKFNYFHWHLTEDQGWRIEIKKYPNLTVKGAYRNGTIIGRYPGTGNDNKRYGGFYTQDEVREIVRYATERHITIIPEIEMPGHSSAAIAAYPWLSCFPNEKTVIPSYPSKASTLSNEPKQVQETWGVFDDVYCAGKDSTFAFLEGVLDEVVQLFPSAYIHVGGDECPKGNWKRCPNCQARMKREGLKDEQELQSYFIKRIENYLNGIGKNKKGKSIIGWDEILEGGLASNAIVMSWQGEKGGMEAAKQKHKVIMTPIKPVYFDYSQTKNEDSLVRGGYNPLEEVYAYEPIPKGMDSLSAQYILGAQANVWTEYMDKPKKVEYMVLPRMSALSEALWSPKSVRNWSAFEKKIPGLFKRYEMWGADYSRAYYDINVKILPAPNNDGLMIEASCKSKEGKLFYVDSDDLKEYKTPIKLTAASPDLNLNLSKDEYNPILKAQVSALVSMYQQHFYFNKATGKNITINKLPREQYPGQGGAFTLVNGIYSDKGLSYPDWMGWIGDDVEATIDLGNEESIDSVRVHTLDQNGSWIYLPEYVEVLVSNDGQNFSSVGKSSKFAPELMTMGWINVAVPKQTARYVRVFLKNYGTIPSGMPGASNKAWLFADEIQVF